MSTRPPDPDEWAAPLWTAAQDLVDLFDACYDDPELFFEEVLLVHPRRWQREVNDEIARHRHAGEMHTKVHIRAAHQAGKGFESAGLVLWWGSTRPGCRILTTAPTWRGVEELLWTEIRRLYAGSLLFQGMGLGRMLDTKWDMGFGWFAVGAASDKPANLEGQHSVIAAARVVDEAKAVPDGVFVATQGLLASKETLDVWISTPSTRVGAFYRRDLSGGEDMIRKVVTIDELIADDVPGAARWKADALIEYGGEDNFEYQSRANAKYIDNAEGALFPFSWIERAMMTDAERVIAGIPVWHVTTAPTLGFDVAGSVDGDENAVAPVHGPQAHPDDARLQRFEVDAVEHWHERDTMVSKDRAVEMARQTKARCIRVDVQGLGKGVGDAIAREREERGLGFYVEEYRSADAASDPERFLNQKAENAWSMRASLERDCIRLPKQDRLREQMAAEKYEVRNGIIRVVDDPKDSPDWWDAVLMGVGGVYHSLTLDDIGGGGVTHWGATPEHLAWTNRE
jgi:phage terminase large subunit